MTVIETQAPPGRRAAADVRYSFVEDGPDRVARVTTVALLLATAVAYLWQLAATGAADPVLTAAAQAGSTDFTAWFFGSLDAGNAVTADVAPGALWLTALSARLFGLGAWSVLVPQALLGVAAVGVLYVTLRRLLTRWAGAGSTHGLSTRGAHWAALAGASGFAVTPVAAATFRSNQPEALGVFTIVLAAYLTTRAVETASRAWLLLAGAVVGVGFLTELPQVVVLLPGFALCYACGAPGTRRRKVADLGLALCAALAAAGWYVALLALTPSAARPWIGGTSTNSVLEALLAGSEPGSAQAWDVPRLVGWLVPAALGLGVAAGLRLWHGRGHPSPPDDPRRALTGGLLLHLGLVSLAALGLCFGFTSSGFAIACLAPASAGAAAIGGAALWADRGRRSARLVLAATTAATGVAAFLLLTGGTGSGFAVAPARTAPVEAVLATLVLVLSLGAAVALLNAHRLRRVAATTALWIGVAAALLGPLGTSLTAVVAAPAAPVAGTAPTDADELAILLGTDAGSYTWVAAAVGAPAAAAASLAAGAPVLAVGGLDGAEPTPTLARFREWVAAGRVHYFLAGPAGAATGAGDAADIAAWVADTFAPIRVGQATLYDLSGQ
jgi:4-amino-4-deoxy-L-arabinose transferase-like glycosyltransferase